MNTSYICDICNKSFTKKNNYVSHTKRKTPCLKSLSPKKNNDSTSTSIDFDFSYISYSLTKLLSKDIKKNNGIYFTPPKTIYDTLNILEPYMDSIQNILEPSCGSCEFITHINERYSNKHITGIEHNNIIYDNIKYLDTIGQLTQTSNQINIIHQNFITYTTTNTFDLIIGNPPYFVMNKKEVNQSYHDYFDGRPNIFILFIVKSISLLNENGIMSFILPRNFMNCLYYDKTRKYINEHFKILNITKCVDKYIDTEQETIILIIQKQIHMSTNELTNQNSSFILKINNYTIFGEPEHIEQIKLLYINSNSLFNLGFKVSVGTVVWNQVKDILTSDSTKTRLIYNSDIKDNKMCFKTYDNVEKKNFINKQGWNADEHPLLVINRGYGTGEYTFDYCLIRGNFEYLIENHLICIKYNQNEQNEQKSSINHTELIDLYNKIIHSLDDERTKQFIRLYFGNNAINTNELNYILPIY